MTQKKLLIFAVGIVSIMIIGGVLVASRKPDQPKKMEEEILPTEVLIPTVDSSVAVDLITSSAGREVTLQIKSIPTGTESIDYELSYQTKQQGLQGVIGTIPVI